MDPNRLLKVTKAVTVSIVVIVVLAVFVRVMYGGDPVVPKPMPLTNLYDTVGGGMGGDAVVSTSAPVMPMQKDGAVLEGRSMMVSDVPVQEGTTVIAGQKIIKTGSLSLRVDSADWTVNEIARIAKERGGYVASSDVSDDGKGMKSGTLTVRVPATVFDEALVQLKQTGRVVLNESVSGQDITEQVVDTEARLKNKRTEEEAYTNILKNQAEKVSDVIEVTRALNQVRGEIESLEGQLKYLNSQADLATISVFISEDPAIGQTEVWRPWQVVKDSINMLIVKLQALANFFIGFVIVILPTLALFALGLWLIWIVIRGVYRKVNR